MTEPEYIITEKLLTYLEDECTNDYGECPRESVFVEVRSRPYHPAPCPKNICSSCEKTDCSQYPRFHHPAPEICKYENPGCCQVFISIMNTVQNKSRQSERENVLDELIGFCDEQITDVESKNFSHTGTLRTLQIRVIKTKAESLRGKDVSK
jgi:hypothetical protein